jgi:hypothetical protein
MSNQQYILSPHYKYMQLLHIFKRIILHRHCDQPAIIKNNGLIYPSTPITRQTTLIIRLSGIWEFLQIFRYQIMNDRATIYKDYINTYHIYQSILLKL